MTEKQKQEYRDCVIYLVQLAQKWESSEVMRIFCADVVQKARFLYNFKPHLFIDTKMDEHLQIHENKYKDSKFNSNAEPKQMVMKEQAQDERHIIYQELCARLPYNVKVSYILDEEAMKRTRVCDTDLLAKMSTTIQDVLTDIHGTNLSNWITIGTSMATQDANWALGKPQPLPLPVLREVTDITQSEKEELKKRIADTNVVWKDSFVLIIDNINGITINNLEKGQVVPLDVCNAIIRFCYEKHLDCNGLILKGLAVRATSETYV